MLTGACRISWSSAGAPVRGGVSRPGSVSARFCLGCLGAETDSVSACLGIGRLGLILSRPVSGPRHILSRPVSGIAVSAQFRLGPSRARDRFRLGPSRDWPSRPRLGARQISSQPVSGFAVSARLGRKYDSARIRFRPRQDSVSLHAVPICLPPPYKIC